MEEVKNERLLHKFKVEPIEGFQPGARLYLDDKHIIAKGYTLEHYAGELAHLILEMDVRADVEYDNLELKIEQPSEAECRTSERLQKIEQDVKENEIPLSLIGQFQYICKIYADVKKDIEMSLVRNHEGKYFTAKTTIKPHVGNVNVLPATLDEVDDFTMEFYPEEYGRVKPILDAEREKSAKNRKE